MTINVQIDEKLLAEATRLVGDAEATAVVARALEEFIAKRHRRPIDGMLELAGKIVMREGYDYKKLRADDHDPD